MSYDACWYDWSFFEQLARAHVKRCQDTYTAQATVNDVNKGVTNHKVCSVYIGLSSIQTFFFQNLESSDTSLLVFGNGDGGGGPLAKMLENVSDKHSPIITLSSSRSGGSYGAFARLEISPENSR